MTRREALIQRNWRHGFAQRGTRSRLYNIWYRMRQRCHDKNSSDYSRYGGKGISVCDQWENSFEAFRSWALASGYSDDLTIERKDVRGNYCPENCTWISHAAQARNKSNNHLITCNGETKTLAEWSEVSGLEASLIRYRLKAGWSPEDAIMLTPSNSHKGGFHGNQDTTNKIA